MPNQSNKVSAIHQWVIHLSCITNDWESVCGIKDPQMLMDKVPKEILDGYRVCPHCLNQSISQSEQT